MIVLIPPPPILAKAASVYRIFLDSGLSMEQALKLTTTILNLSKLHQRALRRAIHPLSFVSNALCKRIPPCEATDLELAVDGFNVLHTIEAAIRKKPLYLSDDLMLRDTLGVHGKIRIDNALNNAITLMISFLKKLQVLSLIHI